MSEKGLARPHLVVGTAGHVDHGKSALVRALTGTDPDRLPEEQRRGMTIELGYAFRPALTPDCDLAFVDCPGHERFIHHMVAGAGAITGALLIVSAVEGPAAQTREHLDILRLLGLGWGRVVLTKADVADAAQLRAVGAAVQELVAGTVFAATPPLAVSAHTGIGLDELVAWLAARAAERVQDDAGRHVRLAVDRVFSVAGHGTVVTGTLRSGRIAVGDALELVASGGPAQAAVSCRVRGVQSAHRAVEAAGAGNRVAVNVHGVAREDVARGAWLASPGSLGSTLTCDCRVEVLAAGAVHRQRVQVHHGTASAFGRLLLIQSDAAEAGSHDAQLRLESPLALAVGDRLILRRPSPSQTIAGGVVLALGERRHRRKSAAARDYFTAASASGGERLAAWLASRGYHPPTQAELERWAGGPGPAAALLATTPGLRERNLDQARHWWLEARWDDAGAQLVETLASLARHQPERPWRSQDELVRGAWSEVPAALLDDRLGELVAQGRVLRWEARYAAGAEHLSTLPGLPTTLRGEARALLAVYAAAGLAMPYDHPVRDARPDPGLAERTMLALRERGWLIQIDDRQHLHRATAQALVERVSTALDAGAAVDVQWLKQQLGLTRKTAVPLLEWLDRCAVTRRAGDRRVAGPRRELPFPALGPEP